MLLQGRLMMLAELKQVKGKRIKQCLPTFKNIIVSMVLRHCEDGDWLKEGGG
jgi:hypothetical protein